MIDISNMTFGYKGAAPLYSQLSMQFGEGRIYGLLGKNGSGKSTLLYLISGLLRPKAGRVTVNGQDSSRRNAALLSEVYVVPEEFDLPDITLAQYVSINRPFYPRFSQEVLEKCLKEFELSADLHLRTLSMGQKKKVYMSFALAANTSVLIMDEPTNGLDIPSKSQFRRVVAQNMTDDRTVIISTHQVHDVEALLDHIVVVDHGRKLFDQSAADVCRRYRFALRRPGESADDAVYSEPSLQGTAVVTRRAEGDEETALNLELLFDAIAAGRVSDATMAAMEDAEAAATDSNVNKNQQ